MQTCSDALQHEVNLNSSDYNDNSSLNISALLPLETNRLKFFTKEEIAVTFQQSELARLPLLILI